MAMVDFSNAKIEPAGTVNTTGSANVSLNTGWLKDSNHNNIGGNTLTQLINQQKQLMYLYQGTFTASGTEFYIWGGNTGEWRVYNISFSSGDTYVFQINASLVCN